MLCYVVQVGVSPARYGIPGLKSTQQLPQPKHDSKIQHIKISFFDVTFSLYCLRHSEQSSCEAKGLNPKPPFNVLIALSLKKETEKESRTLQGCRSEHV